MKYYILQFKFLTPVHFGTAENKKAAICSLLTAAPILFQRACNGNGGA